MDDKLKAIIEELISNESEARVSTNDIRQILNAQDVINNKQSAAISKLEKALEEIPEPEPDPIPDGYDLIPLINDTGTDFNVPWINSSWNTSVLFTDGKLQCKMDVVDTDVGRTHGALSIRNGAWNVYNPIDADIVLIAGHTDETVTLRVFFDESAHLFAEFVASGFFQVQIDLTPLTPSDSQVHRLDIQNMADIPVTVTFDAITLLREHVETVPDPDPIPDPTPDPIPDPVPVSDFVKVSGGKFWLDGKPFYFNATNFFPLVEVQTLHQNQNRAGQSPLQRDFMDECVKAGIRVVRAWGFQDKPNYPQADNVTTIQVGPNQYNMNALKAWDKTIAEAEARGLRLIFPLVNEWEEYGGRKVYEAWGGGSFYAHEPTIKIFEQYIRDILNRTNTVTGRKYKDEPSIMAWEIGAELRNRNANPTVLRNFYQRIAKHIKSIDENHLVGTGEEGFDQREHNGGMYSPPSAYGESWSLLDKGSLDGTSYNLNTAIPEIDFAGCHFYPGKSGPSYGFDARYGHVWLADHAKVALFHQKPMIVGEYGYKDKTLYEQWMKIAEDNMAIAGMFLWQYVPKGTPWYYTIHEGHIELPDAYGESIMKAHSAKMNVKGQDISVPDPLPVPGPIPPKNTYNIMPMGDSITEGSWEGGYRAPLKALLNAAGYQTNFVGSKTTNGNTAGFTDKEHEGYNSATIFHGGGSWRVWKDHAYNTVKNYDADVILLLLGINDLSSGIRSPQDIAFNMRNLLNEIWRADPSVHVILGTITPAGPGRENLHNLVTKTKPLYEQLVSDLSADGNRISLADLYSAVDRYADLPDNVHPSNNGYRKLAQVWHNALVRVIDKNASWVV